MSMTTTIQFKIDGQVKATIEVTIPTPLQQLQQQQMEYNVVCPSYISRQIVENPPPLPNQQEQEHIEEMNPPQMEQKKTLTGGGVRRKKDDPEYRRSYNLSYREKNKEVLKEKSREYQLKNKDAIAAKRQAKQLAERARKQAEKGSI